MQFHNGANNLVLKRLVILSQVHFSTWILHFVSEYFRE